MTYRQLFYLKYALGVSTHELMRRYPACVDRVSKVALLDIPEEVLREIILEEKLLNHLIRLKRRFLKAEGLKR